MVPVSVSFHRARITASAVVVAKNKYLTSKNGRFYDATYPRIIAAFQSGIEPILLTALVWLWMRGDSKPKGFEGLSDLAGHRLRPLSAIGASDRKNICILFEACSSMLGPVGASKYLHFLYPLTFVMWDSKIQSYVFGNTIGVTEPTESYWTYIYRLSDKVRQAPVSTEYIRKLGGWPRAVDIWLWSRAG
jgi:hypothetical protein